MEPLNVLLFSGGGVHDHEGCSVVLKEILATEPAFRVTHVSGDLDLWTREEFMQYDCMVFYWTIGDLTDEQMMGLSRFISSGKGFVGVHGATASFKQRDDFRALIGGYLVMHPRYRQYQVSVVDPQHEITRDIEEFMVTDEQYITSYDARVDVLATALYRGMPSPVIWTKKWGRGKIVFNALGHDPQACRNETFAELLKRSIFWATRPEE